MKLIIFGIGKIYKIYGTKLPKENILAFTDNYIQFDTFEDRPMINPSQIKNWQYDYVVIFTSDFFEQIYQKLVNKLNIQEEKIISYLDIIDEGKHLKIQKCGHYVEQTVKKMRWTSLLDTAAFLSLLYCTNESFSNKLGYKTRLDALIHDKHVILPIYNNLYKKIYCPEDLKKIPISDCLLVTYLAQNISHINIEDIFCEYPLKVRYILIILSHNDVYKSETPIFTKLDLLGDIVSSESKEFGKCFIVDVGRKLSKKIMKIYTVGHTSFDLPPYSLYKDIFVGNFGREYNFNHSDSQGDNIARYNDAINETTALYWIWKNSKEDYVGLCHYRRYFAQSFFSQDKSEILQENTAKRILQEFDIILPQVQILMPNIKEQLLRTVDKKAFEEGWKRISDLIKERQPEYWTAFKSVFYGIKIFPCNMFVAKKKTIDRYCEWLFSFILGAVEDMDISEYDYYSKRIIGFFVERLFTVWLVKQNLKIKELPIIIKDTVNKK